MMESFTLDRLRRLLRAGRKKKACHNGCSFKRSESFKRISIRKNYLDRGGKARNPIALKLIASSKSSRKVSPSRTTITIVELEEREDSAESKQVDDVRDVKVAESKFSVEDGKVDDPGDESTEPLTEPAAELTKKTVDSKSNSTEIESLIIDYGEWIRCIRADEKDKLNQKLQQLQQQKKHEAECAVPVDAEPTNPLVVGPPSAVSGRDKSDRCLSGGGGSNSSSSSDNIRRRENSENGNGRRQDSGGTVININLGRIWMDAPLAMTTAAMPCRDGPRSLELPRVSLFSSSSNNLINNSRRMHYSLDSASVLKDKRDDEIMFSSFGRVANFLPPSPSLSACSASSSCDSADDLQPIYANQQLAESDDNDDPVPPPLLIPHHARVHADSMYRVVVDRTCRSKDALKLDPIIFVPPERRPTAGRSSKQLSSNKGRRSAVHREPERLPEINNNYSDPFDARKLPDDSDDNVSIYKQDGISEQEEESIYYFEDERNQYHRGRVRSKCRLSSGYYHSSQCHQRFYQNTNGNASLISAKFRSRRTILRKKSSVSGSRYVIRKPSIHRVPPSTSSSSKCSNKKSAAAINANSDITQKGYEKKRTLLLTPYLTKNQPSVCCPSRSTNASGTGGHGSSGSGGAGTRFSNSQKPFAQVDLSAGTSAVLSPNAAPDYVNTPPLLIPNVPSRKKGSNRRVTRNESRYHSEVRREAVQQALASVQNQGKHCLPMPSKRTSVMARSPDRKRVSDSSSDDSADDSSIPDRDKMKANFSYLTPPAVQQQQATPGSGSSSIRDAFLQHKSSIQNMKLPRIPNSSGGRDHPNWEVEDRTLQYENLREERPRLPPSRIALKQLEPLPLPPDESPQPCTSRQSHSSSVPDVTHTTYVLHSRRGTQADRLNRVENSQNSEDGTGTGKYKVSAKIQQLLNTLKRPKRRPLPEFYEDDDIELEMAAKVKDPNAPVPEGGAMVPVAGEPLVVPAGLPRTLEAAIQRYGSATFKAPVATVLDPNGKLTNTLTYGKLLSRSTKIAYNLLNKPFGGKGAESCIKTGDRVALVYPNNDAINFLCAFYGCLSAGIVPVPIEVPLTRRDAGSQQIGFLLGSCNVQFALTSEACLKGIPKLTTGEIIAFKGWPKLHWIVTEHMPKPPKDWNTPPKLVNDSPAYIEYTSDRDGSMMGVTVTRKSVLAHCQALTQICSYTEGEVMVCVLDFKRETGLWHGILTSVLNGMHVIFIPYALMKINPASWMQMITKYKATSAIVKSRDLHWGLLATKDHKDISLASLRLLLIGDGANPWSLSSCDQFLNVFQPKGLNPEAVCPCASSNECLTVAMRRPGQRCANSTGRGVLSMSGLSYGVVRVDQENSLTSLTLQDCGLIMPNATMIVVKLDGPQLCKSDEVGEICISSECCASYYWGLPGVSNSAFSVIPQSDDNQPLKNYNTEFVRSRLLGFMGPGGMVFVCGSRDGLMVVSGRRHNADDIIATVLAVEPMKFVYRGRIAVFSIRVLRDERICVIAEQRPECSEEESFQWMSRVLQAVDSIHQVGLYCLALVPPNYLPKTPLGGIHLSECKHRFLEGTLHPANVLICPHTCVTNLPKPREIHYDVGPASVMVGNIVQGNRLASAQGRDLGLADDDNDTAKKFISEILKWRAQSTSEHVIFTSLNSKGAVNQTITCLQLHKRAEKIACLLLERAKINTGDHVALIFPPGIDLICAFYGCLYIGAVPVTIRPPHPQNLQTTLPTVRMIVEVSKSALVLSNQSVIKLLKSKEACNIVDIKTWPTILDTDDVTRKKHTISYRPPSADTLAYLDFSVSTTGMLAGIKMTHSSLTSLCKSMKLACELYPSRHIALCLDPYCGLGFALWCLNSVYSGHHSILIPPSEVEVNPSLWLYAVSQYHVRDTFCSYGVMELCTKGLSSSINQLKQRGVNLNCVRTCVVVAEERPRVALTNSFTKLFSSLGLTPRAVSTSFGCRVNIAICLQGASSPEPSSVFVDLRALRNNRVSLVERGSPHSLCLLESGKLLPGVKVIIADPETNGQCGDSHLGEIWVQSPHNTNGYFTLYGDNGQTIQQMNARLVTGNVKEVYARTGYLGFLRRTETTVSTNTGTSNSELPPNSHEPTDHHDAVFVVGALDETITLRGMRFHPIDIENSVIRTHKKIAECAVFTWTNLLVVVVELDGNENEALDLVPLITNAVLEEHHLIVGVAVVVDPGVVPINSRGEKQRMHLRDGFLADQLDPIYVAYNM